jgi:hypothetical protein
MRGSTRALSARRAAALSFRCGLALLAIGLPAACERPLGGGHHDTPLVRLLADPSTWHGKRVLTSGYLAYGFNGPSLYLTPGDASHGVESNSIGLDFAPEQLSDQKLRARVDQQHVAVTGLFLQLPTGDLVLKDVGDIMVYSEKSTEP